ncbi:MAG TPA: protein kinase [Roseiflexaceae bacterium]|nr:protein kinase [Roseiflexaceae bacterium]
MRCSTCQHDNPDGAPFCAECGTRLSQAPVIVGSATGTLPQQTVLQDRYVVMQKLGQGGMGAVYRAGDRRLSTITWAVKEMSQSAISSPQERQQARDAFRHEAEMLAALNHPNLPRVTDHFEQDGKAYLVMEYVPGETLLSFLMREGLPQPQARVFEWMRQLSDALDYLHNQSPPIIFRDLKPANIMLTPNGQVKLIDFGIARLFKPGQAKDTQAFGTIGYSAPEQYGRGQTDARSDVYSLGVLVHQLLTGYDPTSTPFRLPPAEQVDPRVPKQISDALAAATDSDPNRRFASIGAFRAALLAENGQVYARPVSQPFEQIQPTNASYARPNSEPFAQPGSQPYNQPSSYPIGMPGEPARTTVLANSSRWLGIASVALMGLAALFALIGGVRGGSDSPLAGFGYLLAFLPLASGPLALIMGIIALVNIKTAQTIDGRRHAILGIATGAVTLLLCCAIGVMAGSFGNVE